MASPKAPTQATGQEATSQNMSKRKAPEPNSDIDIESDSLGAASSSDGEAGEGLAHHSTATTKTSGLSRFRAAKPRINNKKQKVEEEPLPESEWIEIDYINQMITRFAPKNGLAGDLPPLHDLDQIFQKITLHAAEHKLGDFTDCLGGRKLRVATMCSGTESPILALEMVISRKSSNVPTV